MPNPLDYRPGGDGPNDLAWPKRCSPGAPFRGRVFPPSEALMSFGGPGGAAALGERAPPEVRSAGTPALPSSLGDSVFFGPDPDAAAAGAGGAATVALNYRHLEAAATGAWNLAAGACDGGAGSAAVPFLCGFDSDAPLGSVAASALAGLGWCMAVLGRPFCRESGVCRLRGFLRGK